MKLRIIILLSVIVVIALLVLYPRLQLGSTPTAFNLTGDEKLIAQAVAYALDNEKKMDWEEYHVLKMIDRYYPMQKIDDAVGQAYKSLYSDTISLLYSDTISLRISDIITDIIREVYRTVARLQSRYLFLHSKYDPNFLRMLDKNYTLSGGIQSLDCATETDYYCLLLNAIYCDYYPLNQNYTNSLNKLRDDGYEGTSRHLFIVIQLKGLGCFNNSVLDPLIAGDAKTLEGRENSDTENLSVYNPTLYAERAAYINLSGYPLQEKWVNTTRYSLEKEMKDKSKVYSMRQMLLEALVMAQQL
jgi:hypothetical protein